MGPPPRTLPVSDRLSMDPETVKWADKIDFR